MPNSKLAAPQLVLNSRMLDTSWIPYDPEACARLLAPALRPAARGAVDMNQCVVDRPSRPPASGRTRSPTSGSTSATLFAPDGVTPARFFTHYFNSSETLREYAAERGVPAVPGSTMLEVEGGIATATTSVEGTPVIGTGPGWATPRTSRWPATSAT